MLRKLANEMKKMLLELIMQRPNQMISYAEYIDMALYHPENGYYMRDQMKIGRHGDFITTSNISDVFGKILAKWYAENYQRYQLPPAVCEIGGGTGRFAKSFIEAWKLFSTEPISYILIETSPYHRHLQLDALKGMGKVSQFKGVSELTGFQGLVFANELFDALPVHLVEKKDGKLYEVMITGKEGELKEVLSPLENEEIKSFLEDQGHDLTDGQRLEIPLAMEPLIQSVSSGLLKGIVVTVDYGYTNEEWKSPLRKSGSLRGYYKHQMHHDILQFPGNMDITSHVHFDALIKQGEKYGLQFISKIKQDQFFLQLGILDELKETSDLNPFSENNKYNRAIRSLVMPGGISSSFDVIIQGKEMKLDSKTLLSLKQRSLPLL